MTLSPYVGRKGLKLDYSLKKTSLNQLLYLSDFSVVCEYTVVIGNLVECHTNQQSFSFQPVKNSFGPA